jgi:hypothetical protein
MLPKWHFLYGYIFSIILIYFFNFSLFAGLIVFLSSVFIDLDHVLIYFLKTKNLNPYKFYNWSMKRKKAWSCINAEKKNEFLKPHFILHGIEFLALVLILSFFHNFFFWIFLGVSFHLALDFVVIFYEKEHLSIKLSQIWLWQRNKNKKEYIVI